MQSRKRKFLYLVESALLKVNSIPYQWWVSILKIKRCKVCLKERKSPPGRNHHYWKSIFYTIPVMSVHTEDREAQGLVERKRKLHSSWKESHSIPYQWWVSILKIKTCKVYMKLFERSRKFLSSWNHHYWKFKVCLVERKVTIIIYSSEFSIFASSVLIDSLATVRL